MENEEKRLIEIMQIFYDVMVKKTIPPSDIPFLPQNKIVPLEKF